ncbi:MAG: DUF4162 domain-containing protein, partial [Anaerolineae bacterium]
PQQELLSRYAIPAFEIEVENGLVDQLAAWTDSLTSRPWAVSVSLDRATARVTVSDVETARRELLASAVAEGLPLNRFEMVRPSLEDVFLRLVEGGGSE